jgi:hypothetical protein
MFLKLTVTSPTINGSGQKISISLYPSIGKVTLTRISQSIPFSFNNNLTTFAE